MAYSNYAKTIYEAFKVDILTEVDRLEIAYRDKFELNEDDLPFVMKHGRGVVCRVITDVQSDVGSDNYSDRMYEFELIAIAKDMDRDQNDISDLAEHIKYALNENRTIVAGADYLQYVNIEYPEPDAESPLKTARIIVGVLHDG